jgi:hypothetical protein
MLPIIPFPIVIPLFSFRTNPVVAIRVAPNTNAFWNLYSTFVNRASKPEDVENLPLPPTIDAPITISSRSEDSQTVRARLSHKLDS